MYGFEGNRVIRDTGSRYPIFQAPIAMMARSQWAGAISAAGGMGLVETHLLDAEGLQREATLIRAKTDQPFGFHIVPDVWARMPEHERDVLGHFESARPGFVTLGYATLEASPDKWRHVPRLNFLGTKCYCVVDTLEEALQAEDAGCDGLILAGGEAGGQRFAHRLHIFALIQKVRSRTSLPLVASGGIADGIGMAGAFALGAEGVLMGTRFMAAAEAPLHPSWKAAVAAGETVDYIDFGRPDTVMPAVSTEFSARVKRGEIKGDGKNPYVGNARDCFYHGQIDAALVGTGESAVLFNSVEPVATIMERTVAQFWDEVERLAGMLESAKHQTKAPLPFQNTPGLNALSKTHQQQERR